MRAQPRLPVHLRLTALFLAVAAVAAHGPSSAAAAPSSPVLVAAGDIACDPASPYFNSGRGTGTYCRQLATSRLLRGADTVMPLGDTQYEHASFANFQQSYDRSWGRYLNITRPVIGNHEYGPPQSPNLGARDYWRYFGTRRAGPRDKGWYSFNLGAWHVVALNSQCRESRQPRFMQREVRCGRRSVQMNWLKRDLAGHPGRDCIMAAWHHPRFSSGRGGSWQELRPFWSVLQKAGADVALSGHEHSYERFAPQAPDGARSRRGIRQFVVGTGGKSIGPFGSVAPNSQKRLRTPGVLRLRLRSGGYGWKFVQIGGRTLDRGSASC